jgi:hypothetical protein
MPVTNQYPEDADYLRNLQLSLSEIDTMFNKLINRNDFNSTISIKNRRILYNYYNDLKFRSADLLLKTEDESQKAMYERFAEEHMRNVQILLMDTSDIELALSNASDFRLIANFSLDSLHNEIKAFRYYQQAENILKAFAAKFPNNSKINTELVTTLYNYSLCFLQAKLPDSAITVAQRLKTTPKGNGLGDMRIIESFLFQDKYDEAVSLYEKKKNFVVWDSPAAGALKSWLISDLEKLKSRKLTSPALDKFSNYLKNQPKSTNLLAE